MAGVHALRPDAVLDLFHGRGETVVKVSRKIIYIYEKTLAGIQNLRTTIFHHSKN